MRQRLPFYLVILLFTVACSSEPPLQGGNARHVDFSGSWEMDYSQSDNIQARLNSLVRELRRQQERRNPGQAERSGGSLVVGGGGSNTGASIIGLARMADFITQSQLLEIEQDHNDITVKREGNFALNCEYHGRGPQTLETPMGSEVCGWDGHQMVFRLFLPEGLSVQHRMTLGPQGERLQVATTVYSDRVSQPFTLNRVYNRFDPGANGIRCKMTLTRGKVCTTESE